MDGTEQTQSNADSARQITLTEFLTARIAEDEGAASRAAFGYGGEWSCVIDKGEDWSTVHADGQRDMVGCEDSDVTSHIARHDPARVLAECEAKRQALKWANVLTERGDGLALRQAQEVVASTFRAMASAYADHPDYRDEWRP